MNELLKRTRRGFLILLMLSFVITYFMVYHPLLDALQQSALDNYELLSTAKYQIIVNQVDRSIEGSLSLSSRSMIREKISEYKLGQVTFEELIDYTDSKYSDGVKALDRVLYAIRVVDGKPVSIQGDYLVDLKYFETINVEDLTYSYIKSKDDNILQVISPIVKGDNILGYDVIGYCFDDCIELLGDDTIRVEVVHESEINDVLEGVKIGEDLYDFNNKTIFSKQIFRGVFASVSISSKELYFEGNRTAQIGLIAALFCNIVLFIIFDLIIIKHARDILKKTEGTRDHYKNKANIDGLTGAFSRHYLKNWIDNELDYVDDHLALVMMDVDDFKNINDTYGHAIGDEVLIKLSDLLKKSVRDHDMVIRYGGDEFLLILQDVDYQGVDTIMERVNENLENFDGYTFKVSVSYGIDIVEDKDLFDQNLKNADEKMYLMKKVKKSKTN